MTIDRVEATSLWRKGLMARDNDPDAKYRDRLRSAFLTMRENVIPFVRNIHRDVLGLTVHEESHLDALWDTASRIAGDEFELTPIEAFVFGASVLLHDTGMAIATYPGGMAELRETTVWRDAEAGARARRTENSAAPLTDGEEQGILFAVLRKLHAEQAEKLIGFTFKRPNREEAIPLLQDIGLRDALGEAIGKIAHSHHWNSSDLSSKLATVAGTVPGFPTDWTLNEVKVACLLRCADAAHIDSLRAPTMLFAISNVDGHSAEHWSFQNKLNAVALSKGKLVYYAGQSFGVDEASSWWLAYDTMRMIDGEIKSCNAILDEVGASQFEATGVQGVESPRLLSKTVRAEGWSPISAEVKVSDPVHLARTLGGRNLYGSGAIAPVRELLQNAVDAVRARRAHESRDEDWGKIRLIVECPDPDNSDVWLHVDDTGTGMSERVVTGPLIDFGKSFWSSTLLEEEFPGLRSHAPKLVGKFGIGFFSVFLLGDAVRVITRRFDASESSAAVLSFDELTRRPLLRPAVTGELPLDYTTRVSVKLSSKALAQLKPQRMGAYRDEHDVSFVSLVTHLVATANVDIEIIDRLHGETRKHSGKWLEGSARSFLEEVCSLRRPSDISRFVDRHHERVRPIVEEDNTVVGRGALLVPGLGDGSAFIVSVGGFSAQRFAPDRMRYVDHSYESSTFRGSSEIVGAVIGDTYDAARAKASVMVSNEAIARWAQEQDSLIDPDEFTPLGRVSICQSLIRLGAESAALPFGFLGGQFATIDAFRAAIADAHHVDLPLTYTDYKNSFEFRNLEKLTTPYFTSQLHPTVAVVHQSSSSDFLSEEERKEIVENGRHELDDAQAESILRNFPTRFLAQLAQQAWGDAPICSVERVNLVAGNAPAGQLQAWALRLKRRAPNPKNS